MSALTKADLSESLFLELGLSKKDSKALVESFFSTISDVLEEGHPVKLSNLGNFDLRDKEARPGRNPKTMEVKEVKARRVVTFHAGQKLKALVEASTYQK
ncbi:MAG: integration host factor subunit alpha [Gammaproteobacteria bacterium]|nr:integration host factor subunit alpha [Gammaproteobacteria bacterium]